MKKFFIVGCVRSGTTFLRDILSSHQDLYAPNETHFYRTSEPFGTRGYRRAILEDPILVHHRELDGISKSTFEKILDKCFTRKELMIRYANYSKRINKPSALYWFDKSPQNIYGLNLILSDFPGSKFVCIVRDPVNVVASLKIGKIMHVPSIIGACNYWLESIKIICQIKARYPKRILIIKYENLCEDFNSEIKKLYEFLDLNVDDGKLSNVNIDYKNIDPRNILNDEDFFVIKKLCFSDGIKFDYFNENTTGENL